MFGKRQKENNLEEIKPKGKKKKGRKKKVIAGAVIVAVLGTAGTAVYSKTQKQPGNHSEVKEAKSAEENTCVVTLTDNGTTLDDTVTVTDTDGNDLGSGTLYIHEPFEITGTTGTVASVSVSENEKVTSGEKRLVLNGVESDSEYEELMATREARTATLKKLLSLTKNPQITADQDGTIQDVNVSASQTTDTTTSSGTSNDTGVSKMSYTRSVNMTNGNSTVSFQKLSFDDGTIATEMQTFSEQEITVGEEDSSDSNLGADVVPVDTEISFSVVNECTAGAGR